MLCLSTSWPYLNESVIIIFTGIKYLFALYKIPIAEFYAYCYYQILCVLPRNMPLKIWACKCREIEDGGKCHNTTLDSGSSREILDTFDQFCQVNKRKESNKNLKKSCVTSMGARRIISVRKKRGGRLFFVIWKTARNKHGVEAAKIRTRNVKQNQQQQGWPSPNHNFRAK